MQPGGHIGFGAANYPAVTQTTNLPITQYTLASGKLIQGPMSFAHYRATRRIDKEKLKEEIITYIKMALNYYLSHQNMGDIAISGYTALACRLEHDTPDIFQIEFQPLWHLHTILSEVAEKKSIELKTSSVEFHAKDIYSYLVLLFTGTDEIFTPHLSTVVYPSGKQTAYPALTTNISINSKEGFLIDVQLTDMHLPHSTNTGFPYQQQNPMIFCSLASRNAPYLFSLPVISITEFANDVIQNLSKQHMIEKLRIQHIAILESLQGINKSLPGFRILSTEHISIIDHLLHCIRHPNLIPPNTLDYLKQHGIVFTETCRVVKNVDMATMLSTYSEQVEQREAQTLELVSRSIQVDIGHAKYKKSDNHHTQTNETVFRKHRTIESQTEPVIKATPVDIAIQTEAPRKTYTNTKTTEIVRDVVYTQTDKNTYERTTQTPDSTSSSSQRQAHTSLQQSTQTEVNIDRARSAETGDLSDTGKIRSDTEDTAPSHMQSAVSQEGAGYDSATVKLEEADTPTTTETFLTGMAPSRVELQAASILEETTEMVKGLRLTSLSDSEHTEADLLTSEQTRPDTEHASGQAATAIAHVQESPRHRNEDMEETFALLPERIRPIARKQHMDTVQALKLVDTYCTEVDRDLAYLQSLIKEDRDGKARILSMAASDINLAKTLKNVAAHTEKCTVLFCHIHCSEQSRALTISAEKLNHCILKTYETLFQLLPYLQSKLSVRKIYSRKIWCNITSTAYSYQIMIGAHLITLDRTLSASITSTKYKTHTDWLKKMQTDIRRQKNFITLYQELFNWLANPEDFSGLNMHETCQELNITLSQYEKVFWRVISESESTIRNYVDLFYKMTIGHHVLGNFVCALDMMNIHIQKTRQNNDYCSDVITSGGIYYPPNTFIAQLCQDIEQLLLEKYKDLPTVVNSSIEHLNAIHYQNMNETYIRFKTLARLPAPDPRLENWLGEESSREVPPVMKKQAAEAKKRISEYYQDQVKKLIEDINIQAEKVTSNITLLSAGLTTSTLPDQDERISDLERSAVTLRDTIEIIQLIKPDSNLGKKTIKEYTLDIYKALQDIMTDLTHTLKILKIFHAAAQTGNTRNKTTRLIIMYISTIHTYQLSIERIISITRKKSTYEQDHEESHIRNLEKTTPPAFLLRGECTETLTTTDDLILEEHADRLLPILEIYLEDIYLVYRTAEQQQTQEPELLYNMFCIFKKAKLHEHALTAMAHHVEYLAKSETYRMTCMEERYQALIPDKDMLDAIYNEFLKAYEAIDFVSVPLDMQHSYDAIEKQCRLIQTLLCFAQSIDSLSKLPRDNFCENYEGIVDSAEIEQFIARLAVTEQIKHQMTEAIEYWPD
ncbi:hypothetical protein GCM10023116_04430 [Kistimonas scapharcae]|uniref:Uncharacterized protein n=1 Tax=Kistimonas scapharcae TaxID=1036133 RepID=A0ABP8UX36_9GAMM